MSAVAEAAGRLAAVLGGDAAARLAAAAIVEAEALGQPRFGFAMLEEWRAGAAVYPAATAVAPLAWRDCTGCFAPLAVACATLEAEAAARAHGLGAVLLRGVRGFGRLAPFVRHLADAGLAGLALAEGPPFVAPHGGTGPVIGTNPVALGLGQGPDQVVIDMATSSATMAGVRAAREEGLPLEPGIALDVEGRPTLAADRVAALLPRGGQIGSLLGLVVEVLAGVVTGGRGDPSGRGVLVLAIDPSACPEDGWADRLGALRTDWTQAHGHWPGSARRRMPQTLEAVSMLRLEAQLARIAAGSGLCEAR